MASGEEIKVSVVVTTYKRAAKLDRTLASLREQTRLPDELIISDDCSPDNTAEIAAKWRGEFPRFQYSRNHRNLYMPGNLNAGVALARGKYIANLHDADLFHPHLLEKWEAALDAHSAAGFVFSGSENRFDDPTRPTELHVHAIEALTAGRDFFVQNYVGSLSGPVWGTVMARRSAYEKLGRFDATFGFVSDVDMWMRMCGQFDVAYVREPLLILDNEEKPERFFTWKRGLVHDRMVTTNIRRIFAHDLVSMVRHLRTQRKHLRKRYPRLMAGRLYHRDWEQIWEGLRLFRQVFLSSAERDVAYGSRA